jgi:alpha-beta hydrolase superfamily lysophospholipase
MSLTGEVCTKASAERVPHDLPLLFIAGDHDPVGDMGAAPVAAAEMARNAGSVDVTCRVFGHMRHEILNEDAAASVMSYVLDWMEERL